MAKANRFQSGAAVNSGYYLNAARWAIQPVARDGERLPEGKGEWMKIPTLLALILTPVLGLTFLMFLPFIGFALLVAHLASPVMKMFRRSATELAGTMTPGWQPGEAHLTGKAPEKAEGAAPAKDEKLESLQKQIDEQRK